MHTAKGVGERRERAHSRSFTMLAWSLLLLILCTTPARATDPALLVAKSTFLGGISGLILGGTLTLVIEDDNQSEDVVRWGVVIGTFGGFALGVWQAARGGGDLFSETYGFRQASLTRSPMPDRPDPVPFGTSGAAWKVRLPLVRVRW